MKLHYYSDTDSLYIELKSSSSTNSKEVADGVVMDFDENGDFVGIDIQHASKKLDLTTVETSSLPVKQAR